MNLATVDLRIDPELRAGLARLAEGRVLVIDYFASSRCGTVVGDLTARFRRDAPTDGYILLANVDGVPILAERRLVPLLKHSGPGLTITSSPFGRHLAVTLDRPEDWLAFLETPGVCVGKRLVPFGL